MNRLYESSNERILIGWFSDGGPGCHPGIITPSMFKIMENFSSPDNGDYWWEIISEKDKIPDALICYVERDGMNAMEIKGIDSKMANSIMSIIGGDHIATYDDDDMVDDDKLPLVNDILKRSGFIEDGEEKDGWVGVTIIQNPKINHIYWSDGPNDHEEWAPPLREIYILEAWGFDDWEGNIEGIDPNRLFDLMISKGLFER
jgi:hypothetical protein